ncbi:prepilin-type N-terminal cleavage/methylation domain-containing protein [Candidatus Saccharibacteria bacterium]|nr:prepilin-type N-terminal cleavage/methylation domain-containing protein [Candidatus Saccharibacteria bacterium]
MISLKKKQSGFTIVELLIVIVVIGILAAIVITTFTGVQKKGRDADRKSDINSMYSQVEVYFAENGKYPTLTDMNSSTFRTNSLKGLSDDALTDPKGSGATLVGAPAANSYSYAVTPAGCDNTTTGGDCLGFTLTATLESGGTFAKNGSNN